jgi:hypothetical protein
VGSPLGALAHGQGHEDHAEEHDGGDRLERHVPGDELVEQAEADTGDEGQFEVLHAGDDRRGQRRQQQRRARGHVEGEALVGGGEHGGGGGHEAGDGPHQRGERVDGDADEAAALLVLGDAPHGHAGVGAHEEPAEGAEHDGHAGEEQQVVAVDDDGEERADLQARQRRLEGGHQRRGVEQRGHEHLETAEHLRQADGGDGQHQARRVGEAADDEPLDEHTHEDADEQRHGDGHEPGNVAARVQGDADGGGEPAGGAVGEVDDARAAVDEHEADAQQAGAGTADEALEDDAEGGLLVEDDEDAGGDEGDAGDAEELLVLHRSNTLGSPLGASPMR